MYPCARLKCTVSERLEWDGKEDRGKETKEQGKKIGHPLPAAQFCILATLEKTLLKTEH